MSTENKRFDHSMLVVTDLIKDCKDLIELVEVLNIWVPASVFADNGAVKTKVNKEYRDNLITGMNDPRFPREVYEETLEAFDVGLERYLKFMEMESYEGLKLLKAEGLQILKYEQETAGGEGGFYKRHIDGWTADYRQISAICYLNSVKEGGETDFPRQGLKVAPNENHMLFFPSNFSYPHEALAPKSGPKYAIVTWFSIRKG